MKTVQYLKIQLKCTIHLKPPKYFFKLQPNYYDTLRTKRRMGFQPRSHDGERRETGTKYSCML